jgi:hypothetical protein
MRKRRTRQHIIADLGVNFVEKQVLLAGYVLVREVYDYGNDCYIHTFSAEGETENGEIIVQVKATDNIRATEKGYVFDLSVRDLESWLSNRTPTVLILYDARHDTAYFIELQEYFREHQEAWQNIRKFVRVFIPSANLFHPKAVKHLRTIKNQLYGNY